MRALLNLTLPRVMSLPHCRICGWRRLTISRCVLSVVLQWPSSSVAQSCALVKHVVPVVSGVLIALVLGADALALYLNVDRIWDVNVPALEIARSIHPLFAFGYTLVIFALIYNTAFSLFYSTARRFSGGSTSRMRLVLLGGVAAGYAASFMGFKKLIGIMYPVIGWLGVVLLIILAVGWLRERSAVLREENLRRKLIRLLVRKHADDLEFTDEDRVEARTLARASVVDGVELRRDASSAAEEIVDAQDDAAAYARTQLPVDEDLVAEQIAEALPDSNESK